VTEILTTSRETKLKVGEVTCPAKKDDPHAASLQQGITVRLERRKVVVTDQASYELVMEYGFEQSKEANWQELYVVARIRKEGKPFRTLPTVRSSDMRDKLRMATTCVLLDKEGSKEERDKQLQVVREKPKVHLGGDLKTRVSTTPTSPYYIELLVGPKGGKDADFRERRAGVEGGVALAQIDKDEEYRVRIFNGSKVEAACRVYVDGIDVFELSDDRQENGDPQYKHVLVPAGQSVVVPGWHRSAKGKENWNAFVVTGYGDGVASRQNPKGDIGTVKVVFADSYTSDAEAVKGRSASMETGRGRDLGGKQQVVERKVENPHECVVVRYTRGIKTEK
jgi:hypothetical protein